MIVHNSEFLVRGGGVELSNAIVRTRTGLVHVRRFSASLCDGMDSSLRSGSGKIPAVEPTLTVDFDVVSQLPGPAVDDLLTKVVTILTYNNPSVEIVQLPRSGLCPYYFTAGSGLRCTRSHRSNFLSQIIARTDEDEELVDNRLHISWNDVATHDEPAMKLTVTPPTASHRPLSLHTSDPSYLTSFTQHYPVLSQYTANTTLQRIWRR